MQRLTATSNLLRTLLSSRIFFLIVIGIFTLSSLWVAIFSLYPMAFDEDFHMGLIRIYASSWLPYGIEHTRDMATFGSAAADPSYLWQYLLSFPYRLMEAFGWNERSIVTVLRVINVATVTAALVAYRQAFLEAGLGKAKSNFAIALFSLIPILPVLAGQVNYDNPLLLLTAFTFLFAMRWYKTFKKTKTIPAKETYLLALTILFTAPVKYAYLPLAAGVVLWLIAVLYVNRKKIAWDKQWGRFVNETKRLPKYAKIIGIILCLIGAFFSAHYATNYVTYGSLTPACDEVFDEEACLNYGPWGRDYFLMQDLRPEFRPVSLPIYIAANWIPDMAVRLTFAVAGPTNDYRTREPLPLLLGSFSVLLAIGSISTLFAIRKATRNPIITLTAFAGSLYLLLLIFRLYSSYQSTGEPLAINGRYLLPLLPMTGMSLIIATVWLAQRLHIERLLPVIGTIALIVLIATGGGVLTYSILAEPSWYW